MISKTTKIRNKENLKNFRGFENVKYFQTFCRLGIFNKNFKKAQVWYTDFMVGILIFFIVIMIYYQYAHNLEQDPVQTTSDLLMDAKSISSSLITQGSPADWDQTNVEIIGLTDGNQRLVQEKLDMFFNMTYIDMRGKLRTPYNYYIYFQDLDENLIQINGKNGIGLDSNNTDNVVSLERIVLYNSKLTSMVVKVWQ